MCCSKDQNYQFADSRLKSLVYGGHEIAFVYFGVYCSSVVLKNICFAKRNIHFQSKIFIYFFSSNLYTFFLYNDHLIKRT